jgi:hypothetical protein
MVAELRCTERSRSIGHGCVPVGRSSRNDLPENGTVTEKSTTGFSTLSHPLSDKHPCRLILLAMEYPAEALSVQ